MEITEIESLTSSSNFGLVRFVIWLKKLAKKRERFGVVCLADRESFDWEAKM